MSEKEYAVQAMTLAIGALKALRSEADQLDSIIAQLQRAIEKFNAS